MGATRLALSNFNGEARAAQESRSANLLPGLARANPKNKLVIGAAVLSKEELEPYDNIPAEACKRKDELISMEDDKNEIVNRINLLRAPPGPACVIKSQLEELLDSLASPIQDRVYWLNGLGSAVTSLRIKSKIEGREQPSNTFTPSLNRLKLAATQILHDEHLMSPPASQDARPTGSHTFVQALRNALPLMLGGGLHEPTIPRSTLSEHSSTPVHFPSSQAEKLTSSPGRDAVRDIGDREHMETWSFLEKHLTGFPTEDNAPRQSSPDSHSPILDGAATGTLVHSPDVASTSGPATVPISLDGSESRAGNRVTQSSRTRGELEGDELSVVKDIIADERFRIWTSLEGKLLNFQSWSPSWPETLPAQYHVYLVYSTLRMTVHSGPQYFASGGPSNRFSLIKDLFSEHQFLIGVQQLCETLGKTPEMDYRASDENRSIVDLIQDLIHFFRNPPRTSLSDRERLEFQMGFYMLEFLDKYFQPIMKAMQRRGEVSPLLHRQLEFMRVYLKFYQGRFQDPAGYRYVTLDQSFWTSSTDGSLEDANLREWIKTVPLSLFHQNCWLNLLLRRPLNLWMGKRH
ncbi:hypothetical protein MJO29_001647 [Puccinia striiformis f. sp. tritici]|nr:hypothetical protein MJO29_001647 [Puccinia striiformis f. sp. tritici]